MSNDLSLDNRRQTQLEQQQAKQRTKHVLFDLTPLDQETEELESKTRHCYTLVKQMIAGKTPRECQEIYNEYIASNPAQHTDELTLGLLVAILIERENQSDFYRDIVTFSKDSLFAFSNYLNIIIVERITKLSDHSIKQLFWVASQLVKGGVASAENTCSSLIRQTAKGDLSPRNVFMAECLIDFLIENRPWLLNSNTFIGPTAIYNVTRLIIDHCAPSYDALRQKETDFVVGLIREKFDFVIAIGKDFLRLLSGLIQKVEKFDQLYNDICGDNPKVLHPNYEGLKQLLTTRTPRRLLQSCLTFDMERKISYLATQVRFGSQKRYQDWFQKQYLSGWGRITLRSDLIRYICTIIHPTNEVLCSDIIPRWAIIGWLLTTNDQVLSKCRQALFYDWFAFDPKTDNIMNIEPAILVMYYSVRLHPQVTAMLVEYLCRVHKSFNIKVGGIVRTSIKASLQQVLDKKVLPSLVPIFVQQKYEQTLRQEIDENFREFCRSDNGQRPDASNNASIQSGTRPIGSNTQSIIVNNQATELEPPRSQAADLMVIDDAQSNQNCSTPEQSRPNQDNNNPSVPLLGFQQAQKILMPPNSTTNRAINQKATPQNDQKWNGVDPIEALINVGPATATSPTANRKISTPSVIKQVLTTEESSSTGRRGSISGGNFLSPWLDCNGANIDDVFMENSSEFPDISSTNGVVTDVTTNQPRIKVIYPFMSIGRSLSGDELESMEKNIMEHLNNVQLTRSGEERANHMHSILKQLDELSSDAAMIDNLGCHIANLISEDFHEAIHNRTSCMKEQNPLKNASPLFVIGEKFCDTHITNDKSLDSNLVMLIAAIARYFQATTFLLLYYFRLYSTTSTELQFVPRSYSTLCKICKRNNLTKSLYDDLQMMSIYDTGMFCHMVPCIFNDFPFYPDKTTNQFSIQNNCDLIRLVVSTVDPMTLEDLLCLCLVGSAKVISREDPMSIVETSLNWDSWEQYTFWKILTAQSVPLENFLSIIKSLNAENHPEAMSSIMFLLQKITEPDLTVLTHVIDSFSKQNENFVTAVIRYWTVRTDLKELTKHMIALIDSRPASPQMKRKGPQTKTAGGSGSTSGKGASPSATQTLSSRSEKILSILCLIRRRAIRNKLIAQPDLLDALSQVESMCNDDQRAKLRNLMEVRVRPGKKRKADKE